jgi:hypothetical protein
VCLAAIHAGVLGRQDGQVIVEMLPGQGRYPGATRNGVSSRNCGPYESSCRVAPVGARAASVRAWLVANGVEGERLLAEGRGPAEPIADNGSEAGRQLNRRVQAVRVD